MKLSKLLSVLLILALPLTAMAEGDENEWNATLRNQYFSGKTITESNDVIELEAPYRAEDPALVPVKIVSKIPQTQDIYIKKFWCWSTRIRFRSSASSN
jgi:sulfur-oxidizing protein SoxY